MLRLAYTSLFYLLTPFVLIRLMMRARRAPAYRRRWNERFALYGERHPQKGVWFHAVSVGEAEAVFPLVRTVRERFPALPILITTTTPTGSARVKAVFGDTISHVYLPYDLPGCVNRFFMHFKPILGVIMETEIWPNLYRGCGRTGIPLVIANARLSEKSARGYRLLRSLAAETLADVALIAAQTEQDAERFKFIGAASEKVAVVGNIKFDLQLPGDLGERSKIVRNQRFGDRPVWLCASTHEGEEEQLLGVFERLRQRFPTLLLVLVPRHPERFAKVAGKCRQRGLLVALHSEDAGCGAGTDVFVVDAMGVLRLYYAAADVAFVGGSLVPTGGHNALEAAAVGVPALFGPHMLNFDAIARLLTEAGAARQVRDQEALVKEVASLFADESLRLEMGAKGQALVERNRGALERLSGLLTRYLSRGGGNRPDAAGLAPIQAPER